MAPALAGAGDGGAVVDPAGVAGLVTKYAAHLPALQRRLLVAAISHGAPVTIDYTNAAGETSTRVIEPLLLDRHLLNAWCHLRDEERMFALDRIDAVAPG